MKRYRLDSFENLVDAFNALPSIGKKSATKLAYHLVMEDSYKGVKLAHSIEDAINSISRCIRCNNMSEDELCSICSDSYRDSTKICIVQSAKDIITIEDSGRYDGLYYIIPSIHQIDETHLFYAIDGVEEVIFAFSPNIENDAMILYIEDRLKEFNLKFTKIAQGVPTGVALDSVDILSLSRALEDRITI